MPARPELVSSGGAGGRGGAVVTANYVAGTRMLSIWVIAFCCNAVGSGA